MRVRWLLFIAVLAVALSARPVQALEPPVAFQTDGTYFHTIHAQLLARQSRADSDSTDTSRAKYLVGGGALVGLAALFVSSATGSNRSLFPGTPGPTPNGDDDILLPPQGVPQTPAPTGTWEPPAEGPNSNPAGSPPPGLDAPVTVTPEPVSMALLASGLAGLGGASLRRRFRKT